MAHVELEGEFASIVVDVADANKRPIGNDNDVVELTNVIWSEALAINTGRGVDTVTINNDQFVQGEPTFVSGDLDISTGSGADSVQLTIPYLFGDANIRTYNWTLAICDFKIDLLFR